MTAPGSQALNIEVPLRDPHQASPLSARLLPPVPGAVAQPTRAKRRCLSARQVIALLSVLVPVLLTFTPTQWQSTVPWDASVCRKCEETANCFPSRPTHCSAWDGTRSCCPLPDSLYSTERCSPRGESCYRPVLGTAGLMVVLVLVWLFWMCLYCCLCLFDSTRRSPEPRSASPVPSVSFVPETVMTESVEAASCVPGTPGMDGASPDVSGTGGGVMPELSRNSCISHASVCVSVDEMEDVPSASAAVLVGAGA